MQETWIQLLGQEDPLEKEMATHSSILTWEIPWTEEPGGLQSIGSQRVGHGYSRIYILFHYGYSQDIEYHSLCYSEGPCCFPILHVILTPANPKLTIHPFPTPSKPHGWHH